MNQTTTHPAERRVRRAHLAATSTATAAAALVLLGATLLWAGDLPDRLATHFDLSGASDDSMPRVWALTLFGLVAVGLPALLVVIFAVSEWWRGERARLFAGFLAGMPAGLVTLFVAVIIANRGAAAPEDARLGPWVVLLAVGVALVTGALVALVVPPGLPRSVHEPVTPVVLAPGERASWFGRATSSTVVLLALGGSTVVVAVAALAAGTWWLWLLVALLAVLVAGVTSFTVTVDARGLTWRSGLGVPRGHVPLEDITGACVVQVSPADFGGFGIRRVPRALGLITRRGAALQVEHAGRRFVATVDDPATGAGLLLGLLDTRHTAA
ncbi:DUF1648 domain-containing protein [Ornithinimicrobium cavernae]|uniref:DUF1648 domain-containing protein n=1 Tax=Ornithinimicrobium cavernae TaxID=2666047 RepID=UPI000D697C9C|nr:DUF1648 domain-containing protein [Ornithinimicrobium cavernae]